MRSPRWCRATTALPGTGGYDSGIAAFTDGSGKSVGPGLTLRQYHGLNYAGPIDPKYAAGCSGNTCISPLQKTLNSDASGWGITSQSAVANTVFLVLFAPNLHTCPSGDFNGETNPGGTNLYGNFPFALIDLVDANYGGSCGLTSLDNVTADQFATFAASHEIDETITSPANMGWYVKVSPQPGQIDDPCNTRDLVGNVIDGSGHYWNLTRDSYGTVVASYVSPSAKQCFPNVNSGVPPTP